jgi:hypothetical protein
MTPEAIAYLRQKAQAAGYNADDLLKVMQYESSGDASRWGGKGGQYFGLIQFGPNERAQFGVDTKNPSEQNQIDATFKYLSARGYKPGMPLIDLYSTVNAGSPGHYNASDGNGTVASHVAKMMGQSVPTSTNTAMSYAPASAPAPQSSQPQTIEDLLKTPQAQQLAGGLLGVRKANTEIAQQEDEDFNNIMKDFHQREHMASMQGLLGGR